MKGIIFLGLSISSIISAQVDSTKTQEIEVLEFTKRLPVTKEIISIEKDLEQKNLGQDLPFLLKNQTSIISSSDTGNGIGYTDLRIRGVAGTSINITLNGVPYNDSESQATYFVNIPDLTSSASHILIQRGVGTSANGSSAFGASVNIISQTPKEKPYLLIQQSFGSFNTQKNSFEIGTGHFLNQKLSLVMRYSLIKSDGYRDRAFSNLKSYNISTLFKTQNTKLKFIAFGGKEKTYQAWNGIDSKTYLYNRKYNPSGEIHSPTGEITFYDNETDNYQQNHYHFIVNQKLSDYWNTETTLHYTKGKGYYENYKQNENPIKYNILNSNINSYDFIRKKWLNNDFYGFISHFYGKYPHIKWHLGGAMNQYIGKHFGNVTPIPTLPLLPKNHEYYRNNSIKNDFSFFAKMIYSLEKLEFFKDLQFRHLYHSGKIEKESKNEGGNFHRMFNFINPKIGFNYKVNSGKIYLSYALAHREPNRDDIISKNDIKYESLHDFELGIEKSWDKFSFFTNLYYMYYLNQLVFSGKIDQTGSFLRENTGKSYRRGIEMGFNGYIFKNLHLSINSTISQNKNLDFHLEEQNILKNLGNTNISLSPNFISNIKFSYNPKNFYFTIQNQYISEQFLDNTNNTNLKLPGYNVLDFSASYELNLNQHQLKIHFNLNNILNKMYINKGYVYNSTPYYFPQAGRNFMLGMSLKFE